jgi:Fe2+ transport system protein FeoA
MHEDEASKIEKIERLDLPCVQRLMTLGMVEGTTIKYVGSALGGDPVVVSIYGCELSLHRDCASHFYIEGT